MMMSFLHNMLHLFRICDELGKGSYNPDVFKLKMVVKSTYDSRIMKVHIPIIIGGSVALWH